MSCDKKYTPGPWSVSTYSYGIVVKTESDKKSKYGASRYACIGGFDRNDDDQLSEAVANANLIAAAPELLEALEYILDIDVIEADYRYGDAYFKAEKAIAKAKGET